MSRGLTIKDEMRHVQRPTTKQSRDPQAEEGGAAQAECLQSIFEGHIGDTAVKEGMSSRRNEPATEALQQLVPLWFAGRGQFVSRVGDQAMQPSASLCRAQETRQRAVAAESTLDNVKAVANAAAAAWAKEALAADLREDRKSRAAKARRLAAFGSATFGLDALLSENPDRGFANSISG